MLSILIPVYNFDLTKLVRDLHSSVSSLGIKFEIIIGDDGSENEYRDIYLQLSELNQVKVLTKKENSGRSVIRNQLAEEAIFPWLLFIDSDSEIPGKSFIVNYISCLKNGINCICGGRAYKAEKPNNPELFLHWKYGRKREVDSAGQRNKKPWSGFQSNNFLIRKEVFKSFTFNEQIFGYGHEDTLFGLELKRNDIRVLHIENPAFHIGLENSSRFLEKARESVTNLLKIYHLKPEIRNGDIRLLNTFLFFQRLGLKKVLSFLFRIFGKKIEIHLAGKSPCLYLFDFYRLVFLCYVN